MSDERKTFPRSVEHARKKISWLNVLAIIMREHFHNIRGAKGTWVKMAMLKYKVSDWLVTAHNELPFSDLNELKECLQYGSSKGSSGALGNGMKATVVVSNKSYNDVNNEIIVLSRDRQSFFGAKTFTVDQLQYDVDHLSTKEIDEIKTALPHFFDTSNVMYINKISGLKEGEYFLSKDRVRAVTQWIDDDLMGVFVNGVESYDNETHHVFSASNPLVKSLPVPPRKLVANSISRNRYVKEDVRIPAQATLKGTLKEIYGPTCRVELFFQHHLMFTDTNGKYVNLGNKVLEEDSTEPNRYRYFSSLTDPESFAKSGILNRIKRLEDDPVYVTNLEPKNLHSVSFSISSPQKVDDIADIKTAWDLLHSGELISWTLPKGVKLFISTVTIDMRISVRENMRTCRELIIGDYNELFFSDESQTLRDIVHEAINELLEDENVDLLEFVSLVEQYLPERKDNFAPLPGDADHKLKKKNCLYVFDRESDGSMGNPWKTTDRFDLGKDYPVILTDFDEQPISDTKLETIGENSGVTFSKLSGKGAFKISVSDLFELNDKGEIENDNISASDYLNLSPKDRGPDRRINVKVIGSTEKKTLVNSVNTPLPTRDRREDDAEYNLNQRKSIGDNRTSDRYINHDNPELVGKYDRAKGILFLNRNNDLVKHYWLVQGSIKYDKFISHRDSLYLQMEDDSRAMSDAVDLMKEMEYKEPEDYVPNFTIIPEDYLINETLKLAIESSRHAQIINERTTESHMTLAEFKDIAKSMAGSLDNQVAIASKVGISQPSVSNYMKGNPISRGIAEKIKTAFEEWKEENELRESA